MKKWKLAAAVLCVCLLITASGAAATSPGSQSDPLVTLGYLNGVFRPQMETAAQDAVKEHQAELEKALDDVLNGTSASSGENSASFRTVTLSQGQALTAGAGCELVLRTGRASCSASLVDATSGGTLNGGALTACHLYLAAEDARTVTAGTANTQLLVRGPYTVA